MTFNLKTQEAEKEREERGMSTWHFRVFLRNFIQVFTTLAPQRVQGALGTKDAYPDAGHRHHSCKP